MNAQPQSTIDERNPWLGLASFTEETRQYFYGLDATPPALQGLHDVKQWRQRVREALRAHG